MTKLVTIGIPVYKRLEYLPNALNVVRAQDYPSIELLVSDNGMNGTELRDIIQTYYGKPYTFRKNPSIVPISVHFNQIIQEASGEYFVLLADDDEITPNYVSELAGQLERYPRVSVAIAKQETMDQAGVVTRRSKETLPDILSGADFVRAVWQRNDYQFECFSTMMIRTAHLKANGGYPDFTRGSHNENALLIKLCLNSHVTFSSRCTFRWRVQESSHGWSTSIHELGEATRQFLDFLDADPTIRAFASSRPDEWVELRTCLVEMAWKTYFYRWRDIYKDRMTRLQWIRAAFGLPFIGGYYAEVVPTLARVLLKPSHM